MVVVVGMIARAVTPARAAAVFCGRGRAANMDADCNPVRAIAPARDVCGRDADDAKTRADSARYIKTSNIKSFEIQ
jgi:hypothetical protein